MIPTVDPGLCGHCRWVRDVVTRTGSAFIYCRKSESDARFPRYPVLPVRSCSGYEKSGEGQGQ